MVVLNSFQDILDTLSRLPNISLPTFKETHLKIQFEQDVIETKVTSNLEPALPFANSEVFLASISQWRRLTAVHEDCKAVYEVSFDIANSNFTYKAGDTIGVLPHNVDSDVNFIISHLELSQADQTYTLSVDSGQKCKIPAHIPVTSTLRHVLTHCVELRSVLKKLFLLALSRCTKDESERKVIEYLCSKEGSSAYQTHILNRNLCLLDLFNIFKSCKPPIEVILANLPRLLPRPYSIVNSGLNNTGRLKICFSVMSSENNRKGLTTGWLENVILNKEFDLEKQIGKLSITNECDTENNEKVPIYMRKNVSGFCLPENIETPLLLIGPGTGVSPFIGFLEERDIIKNNNPNTLLGDVWLFFGCRDPKLDFIYEKELNEFLSKGTLTKLSTSFSRIEHGNGYIQDSLVHYGEDVTKLIKSGASIFVCGDIRTMAIQVKETLVKCLVQCDSKTLEEAEKILCDMQKEKRYFVDIWS